jgi:hypothetical protein
MWYEIGYCDCTKNCVRWGIFEDSSGGYFCPYIPETIEGLTFTCKKLSSIPLWKNIQPTIIKKQ